MPERDFNEKDDDDNDDEIYKNDCKKLHKNRKERQMVVWRYLRGGEDDVTPVLPCEELDIFDAANSLELPAKGSVCGSRSGLPDCMPEDDNQTGSYDLNYAPKPIHYKGLFTLHLTHSRKSCTKMF